jgi:glycosyltransferase involved in cell wall biosynthesis
VRVDQVVPSFASRDAIGVHTVGIAEALRDGGIESDIFYGHCPTPEVAHLGRPVVELGRTQKDRFLLYQSSIGSPVFEVLAARSEPKMVNYHNITPAALLEGWEPPVGYELNLGRAQLRRLAPEARLGIADSQFNQLELKEAGYGDTEVVPLLIDMTSAGADPDHLITKKLAEDKAFGGADLLFVGKVSPHKAPHDLVKMLAVLRQLYDPRARLHLIGRPLGHRYEAALLDFIGRLGLEDAVFLKGSLNEAQLEAYYRAADVFVCASEHEGFCVPVVEAMAHGVPVVAYGATAVPETVAGAGIVLDNKEPLRFAASVARVLDDQAVADALRRAGMRRSEDFSLARSKAAMVGAIRRAIGA